MSNIDYKKVMKKRRKKEYSDNDISMIMVMSNLMTKRGPGAGMKKKNTANSINPSSKKQKNL